MLAAIYLAVGLLFLAVGLRSLLTINVCTLRSPSPLYVTLPSSNTSQIAEVYQETWPICTEEHWTATYCKEFIDRQILGEFTGRDKYIRVIIKNKRKQYDTWYNTVVITMVSVVGLTFFGLGVWE